MGLKRTGNYRAAALYGIVALATLAFEVVIGVYVVTQAISQIRNGTNSFAGFGIIIGAMVLLLAIATPARATVLAIANIARERGMHADAEHDSRGAPLATFQPDAALALKGGETLELIRVRRGTVRPFLMLVVVLLILALYAEFVIAIELPAITPFNNVDPFAPVTAPAPSLLDWVSVAFAPVLCLCVCVALIPSTLLGRRQRIVADDRGIALELSGRKSRFVPWNDIVVFARPTDNKSSSPVGSYVVWGRENGLVFEIGGWATRATATKISQAQSDIFDYVGGYEAYEANARRLLATITDRSSIPLRTFAGNTALLRSMTRRFPGWLASLELDDVLAAPEAELALQPRVEALAAMEAPDAAVTLRARVAVLPVLVESLIWCVLLAAGTGGVLALQSAGRPYVTTPWQDLQGLPSVWMVVAVSSIVFFLVGMAAAFTFARRQSRMPAVSADAAGLRGWMRTGGWGGRMTTLPWGSIRGWAVLPAAPGSGRPATYFAFTDDQKLIWREPENARLAGRGVRGDQREAYRERAEALHALIVARTGLPLKTLANVDALAVL